MVLRVAAITGRSQHFQNRRMRVGVLQIYKRSSEGVIAVYDEAGNAFGKWPSIHFSEETKPADAQAVHVEVGTFSVTYRMGIEPLYVFTRLLTYLSASSWKA